MSTGLAECFFRILRTAPLNQCSEQQLGEGVPTIRRTDPFLSPTKKLLGIAPPAWDRHEDGGQFQLSPRPLPRDGPSRPAPQVESPRVIAARASHFREADQRVESLGRIFGNLPENQLGVVRKAF